MAVRFFRFAHAAGSGQRRPWWPATSPSRWRPTCSVSSAADATTEARPDQARGPSPAGPGGNPFPGLGWSVPSPGQEKTGDFDSSRPSPPNRARHRPLRCLSWAPAHRRDPRYEAGTGPRAPSGAPDGARSSSRSPPDASSAWACSCCCGRAWPASWAGRARWCSPGPCRRLQARGRGGGVARRHRRPRRRSGAAGRRSGPSPRAAAAPAGRRPRPPARSTR